MHPTTTTNLSDAVERLVELNGRLMHASFMPQEQLLGLLVSGSLIIQALATETTTTEFTDEEVDFIAALSNQIEDEQSELYGLEDYLDDNDQVVEDYFSENSENEDWDS